MKKKDIEFLDVVALRGPNIWTYRPVLEAWVDIGELEDYPSNTIPGFYERLTAWLPTLIEHRCSPGVRGGFLSRVKEGTWPGHILEHVTLELQNLAGLRGGFGKARETSTRGVYKVVVRAWQEQVTRTALNEGRDLVMAAIEDRPFDVDAAVTRLRRLVDKHCLGPSTACIVDAADDRDIPYIRLFEGNLVQFGYGSRQRRIWTAETDRTSAIAEGISRDKDLTKELLSTCGVPVPEGRLVDSEDDAWSAAEDIGLPVVVKPYDGNHGRGVFTNLTTREEVISAYRVAVDEGSGVIVERFVLGNEHRLLVVGNRMVAAAAGEPAWVTGDGKSTLTELIDHQINTDPRRGRTENHPLNPVRLDSAARLEIARQGLTEESVPADGQRVLLLVLGRVDLDVVHDLLHALDPARHGGGVIGFGGGAHGTGQLGHAIGGLDRDLQRAQLLVGHEGGLDLGGHGRVGRIFAHGLLGLAVISGKGHGSEDGARTQCGGGDQLADFHSCAPYVWGSARSGRNG